MTHNPKMKLKDIRDYHKNVREMMRELRWLWFIPAIYFLIYFALYFLGPPSFL